MNKIYKIAILALLVMGLVMACTGCGQFNNSQVAETKEEVLTEEDALKAQVEEFPEKIVISGYETEEAAEIFNTFSLNHPEYFWLPLTYSYYETEDGIEVPIEYPYDADKLKSMKKDLDTKVEEVAAVAKSRPSDYDKALFVHDYIVDNCDYAEEKVNEALAGEGREFVVENTAYGCLLEGRALCGGYSRAYFLIMNKLGIECMLVSGESKEDGVPHGWNIIKMDGEYYHVDITYDDPIVGGGDTEIKSYTFFGLTTKEILETRTIKNESEVPECIATENNYFVKNDSYFDTYNFDSCKETIVSQLEKGNAARIKFGSQEEADKAKADLFEKKKIEEIISESSIYYVASNKVITIFR